MKENKEFIEHMNVEDFKPRIRFDKWLKFF